MRKLPFCGWLILFSLGLTGCSVDYESAAEHRLEYAKKNKGDIVIAVFQDVDKSNYIKGVVLAVEQIQQQGGLLGRNIKLLIEQDDLDFDSMKSTIRRIAANPKVSAVLGHRSSALAIPASVVYEKSKILFLPPFATVKGLTAHNFNYVFRMLPANQVMARQMASIAATLGYEKMVTLYARDDYSRELAFLFEDAAIKQGIELVHHASFFDKDRNFRPVISQFNALEFDAIFLSSKAKPAVRIVEQLREMAVDTPIIGSDTLSSNDFKEHVGLAGNKTIVPTVYNATAENIPNQQFIASYQNKYRELPDVSAAQGYDSVMLFAETVERAQSTIPPLLSSKLHFMPAWVGVTGIHHFDNAGDIRGKKYLFHALNDSEWHMLPAIHIPFLLGRLEKGLYKKAANKGQVTAFSQAFSKKLHNDDYKEVLLDLAHEILKFKRLGIIYEDSEAGRQAADYDLITRVAQKKLFEIKGCQVNLKGVDTSRIEKDLIACYGRLSQAMDAFYITSDENINKDFSRRLNAELAFFKIPALTIGRGTRVDPSVSLALNRLQVDLQDLDTANLFKQLLSNIKVHEFESRLGGLPVISVNIKNLQEYNMATEEILDLSPDSYISPQEFNRKDQNNNKPLISHESAKNVYIATKVHH